MIVDTHRTLQQFWRSRHQFPTTTYMFRTPSPGPGWLSMALTTNQKKLLIIIDFPSGVSGIAAVVNTKGLAHNWR
jgi:hypothetical protein